MHMGEWDEDTFEGRSNYGSMGEHRLCTRHCGKSITTLNDSQAKWGQNKFRINEKKRNFHGQNAWTSHLMLNYTLNPPLPPTPTSASRTFLREHPGPENSSIHVAQWQHPQTAISLPYRCHFESILNRWLVGGTKLYTSSRYI